MAGIDRRLITYLPLLEAMTEPGEGFWEILTDRWWSFEEGKGLLFYRKSPQCNRNKNIANKITVMCHPDARLLFVSRVYLKHDCSDYR